MATTAEDGVEEARRGRCGLPASISEAQKRQAAAGTTVMHAEAEGEDEESSRFCPPWGDDSPAHTRPTRAASQSGAARRGELEGDPAEVLCDLGEESERTYTTASRGDGIPSSSYQGLIPRYHPVP
uniref:Uncharacterized protein n=1 Tax=Oryza sativa subsp. japonica TaxID=39947 RepID=Q75GL4_ORYSJ|nr:hypothetical protein [Oryza sativa Japonica Group]